MEKKSTSRAIRSARIAADVLPQVFGLFSQMDRTVGRSQGGLGIGLALVKRLVELQDMANGDEPYLHLVDGGVSDNLGLRGVLDIVESFEALHEAGMKTPLDHVKRIIVFVVNSLSSPAHRKATMSNSRWPTR